MAGKTAVEDCPGANIPSPALLQGPKIHILVDSEGLPMRAWQVEAAVAKVPRLRMEIVKRSDNIKRFVVLPRRWVVERTFSWFGRNRRLAKDFENLAETLGAFAALASIQLAFARIAGASVVNSTNNDRQRRRRRSANRMVKGPSAGRAATTRLRRQRSFVLSSPAGSNRWSRDVAQWL